MATGCGVPGCMWNRKKRKEDPRTLFTVGKYVKGEKKKRDMEMLYECLRSLRDDEENFEYMFHENKDSLLNFNLILN